MGLNYFLQLEVYIQLRCSGNFCQKTIHNFFFGDKIFGTKISSDLVLLVCFCIFIKKYTNLPLLLFSNGVLQIFSMFNFYYKQQFSCLPFFCCSEVEIEVELVVVVGPVVVFSSEIVFFFLFFLLQQSSTLSLAIKLCFFSKFF